jgi:hypothetical protein
VSGNSAFAALAAGAPVREPRPAPAVPEPRVLEEALK